MIRLITSRDRTEFAARVAASMRGLSSPSSSTVPVRTSSDAAKPSSSPDRREAFYWFAEKLDDERYMRLDRFCFLLAAFVVWSYAFFTN